jgi:hypothetical protein
MAAEKKATKQNQKNKTNKNNDKNQAKQVKKTETVKKSKSSSSLIIGSILALIIGVVLTMAFPQLKNNISSITSKTTKIPIQQVNSENLMQEIKLQKEQLKFHPKFVITNNNNGEVHYEFKCTFEENETTKELIKRFPLKMKMVDLNGTEKYHTLEEPLPVRIQPVDKVRYGDILLFQSRYLAVFYDTFDPVKQYSIVGKIDNPEQLREAVGTGSITALFEPTEPEIHDNHLS